MTGGRLSGLGAWIAQRVSAVFMLGFLLLAAGAWEAASAGFDAWHGYWARPLVALGVALFVVALLLHAWVGVRDVILDYLRPAAVRLLTLVGLAVALLAVGLWAAWLLLQMVPW